MIHTVSGTVLYGIWGSSPNDIVAVGTDQTVVEFDGQTWTEDLGLVESFYDVFPAGASVVVIGTSQQVRQRIAGTWTTLPTPMSMSIGHPQDVFAGGWGTAPDDFFVVGKKGASEAPLLYHYTASGWTEVSGLGTSKLNAIWGASDGALHAVGEGGTVVSGAEIVQVPTTRLVDIAGSGRDAFAIGNDGTLWRLAPPAL